MKRSKQRGSVLVEYLMLTAASVVTGTWALGEIYKAHEAIVNQIHQYLFP